MNIKNINKCKKNEMYILIFVTIFLLIVIFMGLMFFSKIYVEHNNKVIVGTESVKTQEPYIEEVLVIKKPSIQNEEDNNLDDEKEKQIEDENIQDNVNEEQQSPEQNNNENIKSQNKANQKQDNNSSIGELNIPRLNIKYSILSSTSTETLKISLTRYWGTYPNEIGNMVVLGHNYKNGKFFSNLYKINIGDIIKITDKTGTTLDYSVYKTDIIDPYDNSCTSQLTDGKKEITLITCYYENGNAHATKRFIVKARAD